MTVVVILIAGFTISWLANGYFKKANAYLVESEGVWDNLFAAASKTVKDPTMPQQAVGFAAASVMCTGCGCLITQILLDWAMSPFRRDKAASERNPFAEMTADQRATFGAVVANALLYDALRAPVRGFLVRRIVMPWIDQLARDPSFKPRRSKMTAAATSTRRAIAERPEGKKLLALT